MVIHGNSRVDHNKFEVDLVEFATHAFKITGHIHLVGKTHLFVKRLNPARQMRITRRHSVKHPRCRHGVGLGQRVQHSLFGEGTILNFEGSGAQARVQVNFESEGSKWLMLSYAKLQAL